MWISLRRILLAFSFIFITLFITGCNTSHTTNVVNTVSDLHINQTSLLESEDLLIIAHRGASAYAPEHTLASYKLAKELGADYIEIDLQMTKDGHLVAMHDDTVDRTTNSEGKVSNFTLAELKKLDAGSWFNEELPEYAKPDFENLKVPTLREIFEEFGHDVNYYIETKNPDQYTNMESALLSLLDEFGLLDETVEPGKVLIQSFSEKSLRTIHELEPTLPLVQLQTEKEAKKASKKTFQKMREYAAAVGPHYKAIDEDYVKKATDVGLHVHPFTVDDPQEIEQLENWGVAGVFTNFTDIFDQVVEVNANPE